MPTFFGAIVVIAIDLFAAFVVWEVAKFVWFLIHTLPALFAN